LVRRDPHAGDPRAAAGRTRDEPGDTANVNVIIVDDESAGRRTLKEGCTAFADLTVIGEYGDPRRALEAIRESRPDVLFLDIQMASMSGLELARALDPEALPIIVFVTAFDEYAVEAFDVSAVDYLLKPFDDERFERTIERVRERHRKESARDRESLLSTLLERLDTGAAAAPPERILAELGGKFHMLNVAAIELVEASRNYVRITVGRETYHARSTLQHAEKVLAHEPIMRISRSSVVNTKHVREVHRTPRGDFILVLAGGVTVTSSEGYRDKVRRYLDALRLTPAR
jgi:two-component system LytT family response regulator